MAVEFAVLDTETTGFFPEKDDRLVEIAVLRLDAKGKILREFHSAVNPGEAFKAARTHRLKEEDVQDAPTFEMIAGDLIDLLAGAVIVSHNVVFNLLFIKEEFKRLGHKLPKMPSICTLELARRLVPEPISRRLNDVCRELGLAYGGSRSALQEARATRLLFLQGLKLLKDVKSIKDLGVTEMPPDKSAWPDIAPRKQSAAPQTASPAPAGKPAGPPAARPEIPPQETSALDQYLVLLDRILEDRVVTQDETEALQTLAQQHGLDKKQIADAHKTYMKALLKTFLRDGKISPGEKKDLEQVRKLLSLSTMDYTNQVEAAKREIKTPGEAPEFMVSKEMIKGKTVSFAGPPRYKIRGTIPSRMFAESLAAENGMVVKPQVTAGLDYLVVPDMENPEADLDKAQELGVRILAEPVFWRMIGMDLE